MAADSIHGDAAPAAPTHAPLMQRRRRHRSRRSGRALRRQFSAHKMQRVLFLVFVIAVSLAAAFWISHRDPTSVYDPVH